VLSIPCTVILQRNNRIALLSLVRVIASNGLADLVEDFLDKNPPLVGGFDLPRWFRRDTSFD
jgi:hypothetical protein